MIVDVLKGVGGLVLAWIALSVLHGLIDGMDNGLDRLEQRRPWLAKARLWSVRIGFGIWAFFMIVAVAVTCSNPG